MKIYIYLIFSTILTLLLQSGCSSSPNEKPLNQEDRKVDSLLVAYRDTAAVAPQFVIGKLNEQLDLLKDSVNQYNLLQFISRCLLFENRIDTAFRLNESVLNFCNRSPLTHSRFYQLKATAYNNRGVFFQETNQLDSAIESLQTACQILRQSSNLSRLPDIYINLADCYQHKGNYSWAGFYYRNALFIADSLHQGEQIHYPVYASLAHLYQELGNYPMSDTYFKKAEQYWKQANPYETYYFANSRGNYYYVTKEYDEALIWFYKARDIVANFPQPVYRGIVEGNLGEIYLLKGQTDSARYHLDLSVSFLNQTVLLPAIKFYIDGLYASLALQEDNLQEATRLLMQPYDTLHTDLQYQFYHHKRLEELYRKKKKYEMAYYYRDKADVCNDSLRNMKVRNNMNEVDFRYRQDTTLLKKDILIAYTKRDVTQWKLFAWIASLMLVIALLGLVGVILYVRKKRELQYKEQKAEVIRLRMAIVRNRMTPHYIFNVLNTVMPAFRNYEELAEPMHLLIDVLRADLLSSDQLAISLEKEIQFVQNYIQLRTLHNPRHVQIEWKIGADVPMESLIPSMSIQIPVENAMKYAFVSADIQEPRLSISIKVVEDNLCMAIEDNGVGYNPGLSGTDEQSTGSGLKILYRTTQLMNIKNVRKMSFSIVNLQNTFPQGCGTRTSLIVPLNYNFTL